MPQDRAVAVECRAQGFKFTAEQVALLLQKSMKDVTPKG